MFAKIGTLLLIVISAVLLFSVTADAINVDYVGPESSYDNYLFAGSTQYSRAEFDEPYHSVYWYVKGPGETGFGTLAAIDQGDGTSTVSTFSHTFNSGSTSGKEYEITAYVYPENGEVDWDSYTLSVWTPADEVITTPDELTITDDIKIGDSYAFNVDVTSSSSNYVIDKVEVLVDGVSVVSKSYDDVGSATITVSGNLPASAGSTMSVTAKIFGKLKPLGKWTLERMWLGVLRGTVEGFCECIDDGDALGTEPNVPYTCQEESQIVKKKRRNHTRVRWSVWTNEVTEDGTTATQTDGSYSFIHVVPFGHAVTMWIRGDDLHIHGGQQKICKYEDNEHLKPVGKVFLKQIPVEWVTRQWVYADSPDATYDPCDDPYPVEFEDNWNFDF